jgi:hypothetical protein
VADVPPKRPRGRPTLKAGEPSVSCCLRMPISDYDRACELAKKHRTSVPDILRAAFRIAVKQQRTLDEP